MKEKSIFEGINSSDEMYRRSLFCTGKKNRVYRLLIKLARKNRRIVLINLFLFICTGFLVVIPNWVKETALNKLIDGMFLQAVVLGFVYMLVEIFSDAVDLVKNYLSQKMTKDLSLTAQLDAADFIRCLPLRTTVGKSASELMMHQMEVMNGVGNLLLSIMNILMLVLTSLAAFVLAIRIDPIMTVCAFLVVEPLRIYFTRKSSGKVTALVSGQQNASKRVWRILTENFQNLYYIKAQNIWPLRRQTAKDAMVRERNFACSIAKEKSVFSFISFLMADLIVGITFIRSIVRTYYGEITFGQLTVILSYFTLLQARLSLTVTSFLNFAAEKRKLEEKLDFYTQSTVDDEQGEKISVIENISFQNVSFSYENTERQIITDLNMQFSKGDFVVICGKNGGGKSTFINLLLGLYQPHGGEITVNTIPISKIAMGSLRSEIGYLPQIPVIFSGTVEQNLLLTNQGVEREQLQKVCAALGMEHWISTLEEGLQTVLDNPQQTLSGGEKQRIALARAILEKHSLYIFDEPTSALDQKTKECFFKIVNEIRQDAIVIAVTHDEDIVRQANKVYRIGEEGLA